MAANRLTELRGELLSRIEALTAEKTLSAPADIERTSRTDDDDNTVSRDLDVQAPRSRTPSRSGMPRSALEVERWQGDVMADGGNRVGTADCESSLHTGPIGYSVPVGEHDVHHTHSSTYPTSTQPSPRRGVGEPGYTHITQTANREISARDEPLYESSLQVSIRDFGANARVCAVYTQFARQLCWPA